MDFRAARISSPPLQIVSPTSQRSRWEAKDTRPTCLPTSFAMKPGSCCAGQWCLPGVGGGVEGVLGQMLPPVMPALFINIPGASLRSAGLSGLANICSYSGSIRSLGLQLKCLAQPGRLVRRTLGPLNPDVCACLWSDTDANHIHICSVAAVRAT